MRDLLLSELQQVNGGSVQTDLSSVLTQGLSSKELNFSILSLGVGVLAGAALRSPWGFALGGVMLAGWVAFDMFVLSNDTASSPASVTITAPTVSVTPATGRS